MSIAEALPFLNRNEISERPEPTAAEWMKQLKDLRDQTLLAETALSKSTSNRALYTYLESVGKIDDELSNAAVQVGTYVEKNGARSYSANGRAEDGSNDVWAPYEIDVVKDALTIYEHLRTEHSQQLVVGLLEKYNNQKWFPGITELQQSYAAMQGALTESENSQVTLN